jgi:hypothetical protein
VSYVSFSNVITSCTRASLIPRSEQACIAFEEMSIAVTSKLNVLGTNYDWHRNLRPKPFLWRVLMLLFHSRHFFMGRKQISNTHFIFFGYSCFRNPQGIIRLIIEDGFAKRSFIICISKFNIYYLKFMAQKCSFVKNLNSELETYFKRTRKTCQR